MGGDGGRCWVVRPTSTAYEAVKVFSSNLPEEIIPLPLIDASQNASKASSSLYRWVAW